MKGTVGKRSAALMVALVAAGSLLTATPAKGDWDLEDAFRDANDPKGKVVEVVNKLPARWNVRKAVGFVDKYTTSRVRFVKKCSASAWRCVRIQNGVIKTSHTGWYRNGVITIDVAKADRLGYGRSSKFRNYLVAHEFGHARGLPHSHGRNTMHPKAKRQGSYLPLYFNRDQRVTLRKY